MLSDQRIMNPLNAYCRSVNEAYITSRPKEEVVEQRMVQSSVCLAIRWLFLGVGKINSQFSVLLCRSFLQVFNYHRSLVGTHWNFFSECANDFSETTRKSNPLDHTHSYSGAYPLNIRTGQNLVHRHGDLRRTLHYNILRS